MLKKIFSGVILCTLSIAANAQSFNIPAPVVGQSFPYSGFDATSDDTLVHGSNQTWDFSDKPTNSFSAEYLFRTPTEDEILEYSQINLVSENVFDGVITFYELTSNHLNSYGNPDKTTNNPLVVLYYPLKLDSVYIDTFNFTYYSGSTLVTVEGTSKISIIGDGTLITDFGSYSTTKKIRSIDTYNYYTNGALYATANSVTYRWYNEKFAMPILEVSYNDNSHKYKTKLLQISENAGISAAESESIQVFPNPTTDLVSWTSKLGDYTLVNSEGKLVLSGFGNSLSTNNLPAGIYTLKVKNSKSVITKEIIKL